MTVTMVYKKLQRILILCFIISSITFTWFQGWNFIHQIDAWYRINPKKHFEDILYFWKDGISIGYSRSDFHVVLFTLWQVILLNFFEIFLEHWKAVVLSQFVIYCLTIFFGIISAYLFFKEFYLTFFHTYQNIEKNRKKLIIYTLSILYIFNQYTLIYVFYRYTAWTLLWTAIPLTGYILLRYLKTGSRKYFVYFGIITLLTPLSGAFSLGVLPTLLMAWTMIWILLIFYNPRDLKSYFLRFFMFFIVAILLNSWVVIPQIAGMQHMVISAQISFNTDKRQLEYASQFTNILNILRFLGYYVLYGAKYTYAKFPYIWIDILDNIIFQILTYVYPLVLGISLLLVSTEKLKSLKKLYLLIFSAILGLILIMKGVNESFSNIGYSLLSLNSVFFRHPYDRFVHLFAFLYFIVILYLLHKISTFINNFRHFVIFLTMLVGIHLSLAYPLFTGNVIHPYDRLNLSNTSYWSLQDEFKTLSSSDFNKYRVLLMPFDVDSREYSYNISDKIHHPNAKSLIYYIIPKIKVLQYPMSLQDNIFLYSLYYTMKTGKYEEFINILGRTNFKYIVFQKDATEVFIINPKNRKIIKLTPIFIKVLEKNGLILKLFENKNIVFYKINYTSKELFSVDIPVLATENIHLLSKREIPSCYSFIFLKNRPEILKFFRSHSKLLISTKTYPEKELIILNFTHIKITNTNPKNGWNYRKVLTSNGFSQNTYVSNTKKYIEIPFNMEETNDYKLFIRYFKNQKGGAIRIKIDNRTISLNTKNQLNKFLWQDLGNFYLKKGKHDLILENIDGFNAVNLFVLVPQKEYIKTKKEVERLIQNKTIIYLFEAESDLYRGNIKVPDVVFENGCLLGTPEIVNNQDLSNGEALEFNADGKAWQSVDIIKEGYYRIGARLEGKFEIKIGNYIFVVHSPSLDLKYTPPFYLRKGKYYLQILPKGYKPILDTVYLYSVNDKNSEATLEDIFKTKDFPAEVKNYKKINPTLWKVKVNAKRPFMLSFAEAYDPLWEARIYKNGKKIEKVKSIPLYSVINGFWIDQTGDLEIVIRYKPQDWFEIGLVISALTFIGCIGYLFYDWRKNRKVGSQ